MFETIKKLLKKLNKKLKSNTGNSLAEFAVTTAMMATLATTAAPKFSGVSLGEGQLTDEALEIYVETILDAKENYESDLGEFVYVFSTATDDDDAVQGNWMNTQTSVVFDTDGALDFKKDFGNNGISSPFQDGSYAYLVIPGSGSGTDAQAPALIVIDTENPAELNKTLVP